MLTRPHASQIAMARPEAPDAPALDTKAGELLSAADFGAVADGVADDTAALQDALDAAAGGHLYLPPGKYRITDTLAIPPGTTLEGPGACDTFLPGTTGATFYIEHTSGPGLTLGRGCTVEGVNFYYPDQVTTSPPIVYDYTLQMDHSDPYQSGNNPGVTIRDVTCHNAYNFLDLGGDPDDLLPVYGAVRLYGLRVFALNIGIRSGATLSEVSLADSVFSPLFWTASIGGAVRTWSKSSGVACLFFEALQGLQVSNTTFFGARRGVYCSNPGTPNGSITFMHFIGCLFDGLQIGVHVADDVGLAGAQFTGCLFAGGKDSSFASASARSFLSEDVQVPQHVQFTGCAFYGTHGSHVEIKAPTATVISNYMFDGCEFLNANGDAEPGTYYNFDVDDTRACLQVTSCYFQNTVATAQITNFRITNVRLLLLNGIRIFDQTSKPFEIGSTAAAPVIRGIYSQSSVASTWPATPANATIASAATVTLPEWDMPLLLISGNVNITSITPSWPGRVVTLKFSGTPTVTDGSNLNLAGNFVATAGDTLTLVCDGTDWNEMSRSAN